MKKIFVEFPYGDTILKTKENVEKRLEKYSDLIEENYIFEKNLKKELDEIKEKIIPMDSFSFPLESLKETEYVYLSANFWSGSIEFADDRDYIKEKVENKLPEIKEKFDKLREELIEHLPVLEMECNNELDEIKTKRKKQDDIRKEVEELLQNFPTKELEDIHLVDVFDKFVKNNEEYFEKFFSLIPVELVKITEKSYDIPIIRFYCRFDFTVKSDLSISVYNKTKNKILFYSEEEMKKWKARFEEDNKTSWWDTAWDDYKNNAGY